MIACLSPNGAVESKGDGPAKTLLVATLRGVHALVREAPEASWKTEARGLQSKHVSSLLYLPELKLLFAGIHGRAENGGLFASLDEGRSWEPRISGLRHTHVYTLAAERRNGEIVLYAGTEPPAVFRSRDLGRNWEELPSILAVPGTEKWTFPPPPHIAHVKNIVTHPAMLGTLHVCVEQGALLRSDDDGRTWRELDGYASSHDSFYHDVHRLVLAADNPDHMHLATGDGLYFSPDGGMTWEHQHRRTDSVGYPDALFLGPGSERVVYLGGAGDAPETWRAQGGAHASFVVSQDGGTSWSERTAGLPQPLHGNIEAMAMHSWSSTGLAFYMGTAVGDIFGSEDAGVSWKAIATGLPPISKARHYRHFLSAGEKLQIENEARAEGLPERDIQQD